MLVTIIFLIVFLILLILFDIYSTYIPKSARTLYYNERPSTEKPTSNDPNPNIDLMVPLDIENIGEKI